MNVKFRRKGRKETQHWIISLDPVVFKALKGQGRLNHGFTSYRIREFVEPTRCFKCHRYGHIRTDCPDINNPDKCPKCTGAHLPQNLQGQTPPV
ncbi:hypothetical protein AVEN_151084-1 [Araneus ventricosus]|uniref:CCHC-type domain-containing protein n=1 Tax=Araneus ventricosus TaxID=182803 RepID=A0A4Y2Q482_ARAVE|nr:hypothetical protein AVEN_151084-1 [Araneus ventricosus]